MRQRLIPITLVAAAFAILAALPAGAQTPAKSSLPGCHDPRAIARFLALTPEQNTAIKALRTTYKATVDPLRAQIEPLHNQIEDLLDATTPDACQIGALRIQIHTLYLGIEAARTTFETGFEALLTPAQLAKWNALQAVCHANNETAGS